MYFLIINISTNFELLLVLDVTGLPNFKCNSSSVLMITVNIKFHGNQSSCRCRILLKDTNNNLIVVIEDKSGEDISSGDQECLYQIQWQPTYSICCFVVVVFSVLAR